MTQNSGSPCSRMRMNGVVVLDGWEWVRAISTIPMAIWAAKASSPMPMPGPRSAGQCNERPKSSRKEPVPRVRLT